MQGNGALILDYDGVVVDSEPLYEEVEKHLYREVFGLVVPDELWYRFKGLTEKDVYHLLRNDYGLEIGFDDFLRQKRELLRGVFEKRLQLFPDFTVFYERFSRCYRFALVTSSPRMLLELSFQRFGLDRKFEVIITGDDVSAGKPNPEPYDLAVERLGISPQKCVVIEDTIAGIESACGAGCRVIALTTSLPPDRLTGAHLVKSCLSDITPQDIQLLIHDGKLTS